MNRRHDEWNLADVWETIADTVGDAPALIHGDRTMAWSEFDRSAARLASLLAEGGIGANSKVAIYLQNCPAYLEATFAAFKLSAVPVNVNYRYTESELLYLLDNADAEAVVVGTDFADRLQAIGDRLPKMRLVVTVDREANGTDDPWLAADPAPRRSGRDLDDLWFLYTGGTTGMPKGVMWPHRSLLGTTAPSFKAFDLAVPTTLDEVSAAAAAIHAHAVPTRLLPAAPLMHGTSAIASWGALCTAGALVTLPGSSFDADELLDAVRRERVTSLTIVGDAFAKPIVAALEAAEERGAPYDLSSLGLIVSSGVMWSQQVKEQLLARADVVLADLLGSSEGVGFANSVAKRGRPAPTARFKLGEHATVLSDDGRAVEPGSGEVGMLAVGGPIPVGYYKDPDKSAATFRRVGDRVWSIPGDFATVGADGTITLLGRGSVCINTAGEKVYPEEVEEVLKLHGAVADANVVGVADETWGQAVVAVVSLEAGAPAVDAGALIDHCRRTLAGYKIPKRVVFVERVHRGPNGKADYRWAADVVGSEPV